MDCASCGRANRAGARFCDACGAPLTAGAAAPAEARKIVTIVFADLVGSTSLHERLDAESARRLMDRYYRALHAVVERHGGTVVKLLGDGVMAAFGVPRVAEDDAIRAVRAAVGMQQACGELGRQGTAPAAVGLRVAVNTGEVVVSDDHADVVGDPVNVAARLQQEAHAGDVLVGEATRRLVGDLVTLAPFGALALRGRSEAVAAYRVVSLERPAGAPATPFVGRDAELARIAVVWEAAVTARRAQLAVILGSPGLGKSRLLDEFARRLRGGATLLTARCEAAGGATFAPLAAALRALLHLDDGSAVDALRSAVERVLPGDAPDRARIAEGVTALLAGAPAPPEETFFVVRRLLAALAAAQPVVLAIDDLQWAAPPLLDLTEHLVEWTSGVPLLVLVAARPELREIRASLASPGGLVADVVTLTGLDAAAATRLAASVIGADALPAAVAGRVLATSEGNPLFVAELVRMLVHDGALRHEGDRWTAATEVASLEMPPTIHALLAARIERLRPGERTVLERAAIVGRHFSRAALAHLLPAEAVADLDARLESLRRSELIEPEAGSVLGEPGLRFHHALIRDAAYRRILKGTRADLHARFADWLEARAGESAEHDETIGWHLEQAHQHLRELGALDARGRSFGERAARHLAAAGRSALARDDLRPAASLLGRAIDRLETADPARADLALDWCEALLSAGDVGPAAAAIDELGRFGGGSDRLGAWHACFAAQLAALTDPQALRATAATVAAAAETLAAGGDAAGEAKAHSVHALALARLGEIGASEAALDRALAAARRARDRRRANAVLAGAPLAALWGPSPVTRASGRCLDVVRVLRIAQGAPAVEAVALRCQAVLEALRGRPDAARRMIATSRHMVEELGITQRLLEADVFAGIIELLEGDAAAAERCLRTAYEGLRRQGLGSDAAQAAALLGRALLAQDRGAEAETLSHASEALAGDDLKAAIAWRGVRAEALARRGEQAAAVKLARAAVDLAAATDALLDHADARLALAATLRAAGRTEAAAAEETRAIELWEAKGATVLAERARRDRPRAERVEVASGERPEPAPRVRPNAATANALRVDAAVAARDEGAYATLLAENAELVHHPTGTVYDRDAALAMWRVLVRASDPHTVHEPLATLGDTHALCRFSTAVRGLPEDAAFPFGAFGSTEWEFLTVIEVDGSGRRTRAEDFAADRLTEAIDRLYESYAAGLPEGAARRRAEATARSVAAVQDLARVATAIAPEVEFVDHRPVRLGSCRGAEAFLRGFLAFHEIADDVTTRIDAVLALREDAYLVRRTTSGRDRAGGGSFENPMLQLALFGADGLLTRFEWFAVDRPAEALARFDALTAEPPTARFANAAARALERSFACLNRRDWDGLVATFAPAHRVDDRRALTRADLEGESFLASLRMLFTLTAGRWHQELLATRGDRLALHRVRFEGENRPAGPFVIEYLSLVEVDADDRRTRLVSFDLAHLDAAYAELDALHAAGEGAPYAALFANHRAFREASAARDWEAVARLLPADYTMVNHRRFGGSGARMSRDEYLAWRRSADDLGVRADMRVEHVLRLSARAGVSVLRSYGTLDGGAFELPFVHVYTHDRSVFHSSELFDLEQLDAALARYEELAAESPPHLASAATAFADRMSEAWEARDWARFTALAPPGVRLDDRQRMAQLDSDRDRWLETCRPIFEMTSSPPAIEAVATRGNRLALVRVDWTGSDQTIGPSGHEVLLVVEVDDAGDAVAIVFFDGDAGDAARAELEARFEAGEAAAARRGSVTRAFTRAFAARDWDVLATLLAPDLVVDDHRRLGWETLHGPEAYVRALRSLVELAPDTRLRIDHIRMADPAFLYATTWVGTREGGAFEEPSIIVCELDERGRIRRFDQYDVHQLDEARARLEALHAPPEPLRDPAGGSPAGGTR